MGQPVNVSKTYTYYSRVTDYSSNSATLAPSTATSYTVSEPDGLVAQGDVVTLTGVPGTFIFTGYTDSGDMLLQNTGPGGGYFVLSNQERSVSGSVTVTEPTSQAPFAFCFLAGTQIATPRGNIPIEQLAIGDLVVTRFGGFRPIKWVSYQRMDGRFLNEKSSPVRIKAGALGENQPMSDLVVSPSHSICINDVLVSAAVLVNDVSIFHERVLGEFVYHHIDLGAHDVVMAEGAWAESYLESSNRQTAHNYQEYLDLNPSYVPEHFVACLPMITNLTDQRLVAVREKINARIAEIAFSTEADVHLSVDGARVDCFEQLDGTFSFTVPSGAQSVRIMSRVARPCTSDAHSFDVRRLGICIRQMVVETAGEEAHLPVDEKAFSLGWEELESEGAQPWRWTTGDAVIPTNLLPPSQFKLHVTASLLNKYIRADQYGVARVTVNGVAA